MNYEKNYKTERAKFIYRHNANSYPNSTRLRDHGIVSDMLSCGLIPSKDKIKNSFYTQNQVNRIIKEGGELFT